MPEANVNEYLPKSMLMAGKQLAGRFKQFGALRSYEERRWLFEEPNQSRT